MARAPDKRVIGVRLPPRIPAPDVPVRHPGWLERCTCGHIAAHHSHGKANRQAAVDTNGFGGCHRCDCRKATYPPNGDPTMSETRNEPTFNPFNGTAKEHLDWCVYRAMEYANRGDMTSAWASFTSDVTKHPGTRHIAGHTLYGMAMISGIYDDAASFREFIGGFSVSGATA